MAELAGGEAMSRGGSGVGGRVQHEVEPFGLLAPVGQLREIQAVDLPVAPAENVG